MKFSELEYIALEGGGGKGAVYKGAIVALEKLFDEAWHAEELLKIKDGKLIRPSVVPELLEPANVLKSPEKESRGPTSILDYYQRNSNLKIKGIAGSSAGAITALPLAMGLNSSEIDQILQRFPFEQEFLPNHKLNEGKYRMVGMGKDGEAKILVAEDHFKKLGEDKLVHYEFTLQDKDLIGRNWLKSQARSAIVSGVFTIIFAGLKESRSLVSKLVSIVVNFINNYNYLRKWSVWLKSNVIQQWWSQVFGNTAVTRLLTGLTPVPWNLAIKQLLRFKYLNRLPWGTKNQLKLLDILPADNVVSALGNAIWDRGIYAGFEVRELFFKILLKAISKDTHFRRGLLERSGLLASLKLSKDELDKLAISFDSKYDVKADAGSRITMIKLAGLPEKLTFREFYEITNVNLSICVTNATTSQPIYFSHYFTPDFPVLEAVGASMNFPIAFKPTYNEANVLLFEETPGKDDQGAAKVRTFLNPADFVKFKPHEPGKRFSQEIFKESFSARSYNRHLAIVLSYIKQTSNLSMSVNGNLSFRSFLPYLRQIIESESFHAFDVKDHVRNRHEVYTSDYMKSLCYFYYNSAFKGLFIDGGVTNNLPLSIFTLHPGGSEAVQNEAIKKGVLSLKLDNSYPEVIKGQVFKVLAQDKGGKTLEKLSNWDDKLTHYTFGKMIFKNPRIRRAFERNKSFSALPKEVWIKVSRELVSEYQEAKRGFTPWNRQVNVVSALMDSLQFGFDQGQIESIDDNENIIPLYCYGVSTLDFDLTSREMKPLVEMAVEESENSVMGYFANRQITEQK